MPHSAAAGITAAIGNTRLLHKNVIAGPASCVWPPPYLHDTLHRFRRRNPHALSSGVSGGLTLQVSAARADSIIALVGDDILATIDGRTAKTTALVKIDGVGPILGIDVRPADGRLYALASDGTIATIDPVSGKATAKAKLDMLPQADSD